MDLNGYVALYIPTKTASGHNLAVWKRKEVLDKVENELAKAFGGFTKYEAVGGWVGEKGLVKEYVTVVKAFYQDADKAAEDIVRELAGYVKSNLSQEAVTIEMNGGISFI